MAMAVKKFHGLIPTVKSLHDFMKRDVVATMAKGLPAYVFVAYFQGLQ